MILRSQANLVAARAAHWGEGERATARLVLDRICLDIDEGQTVEFEVGPGKKGEEARNVRVV